MTEVVEHYRDAHRALAGDLPGGSHPWVAALRDAALTRFTDTGFPTTRNENWKYTRLTALEKRPFMPRTGAPEIRDPAALLPAGLEDVEHRVVLVDGRFHAGLSRLDGLGDGVRVRNLGSALDAGDASLEAHLNRVGTSATPFTELNAAFMSDGIVIELDPRTNVESPIELVFLATGALDDIVSHPRVIVAAEAGARATVVETFVGSDDAPYFTNASTGIDLRGEGACVHHYKLIDEGSRAYHIAETSVRQGADTCYHSYLLSVGGALVRNDINVRFDAEGSECSLLGVYVTGGRQHMDFHTQVDHASPRCVSNEHYKGVLDGRSRAVFDGRVHVHPDAQGSDARQRNDNLLLSRHAEIDTKPQLEIHADDVKCAHGATIGQLDAQALFYLASRGIDPETARRLLTFGFARDIIDRFPVRQIRDRASRALASAMPGSSALLDLLESP